MESIQRYIQIAITKLFIPLLILIFATPTPPHISD